MAFTRLNKKGQAMVEMAVVFGLIVMCIGIIVTTGQIVMNKNACLNAAFEGARVAVVQADKNTARSLAQSKASEILNRNSFGLVDPQFTFDAGSWTKGNMLTCTVSGKVKVLFPIPGTDYKLHKLVPVQGTITMMIERNP